MFKIKRIAPNPLLQKQPTFLANSIERRLFLKGSTAMMAAFAGVKTLELAPAQAQPLPQRVGAVEKLRGPSYRVQGDQREALSLGSSLNFGDRLETGADSRLSIKMLDDTVFHLGEKSDFHIDAFVFDPAKQEGDATFTLARGAFRMVTGLVTQDKSRPHLTVRTPVATIGIRGTDFWGLQTEDSLQLALLGGGPMTLATEAGEITMTEALSVSVVSKPGARPTPPRQLSEDELVAAASTVAY